MTMTNRERAFFLIGLLDIKDKENLIDNCLAYDIDLETAIQAMKDAVEMIEIYR